MKSALCGSSRSKLNRLLDRRQVSQLRYAVCLDTLIERRYYTVSSSFSVLVSLKLVLLRHLFGLLLLKPSHLDVFDQVLVA